MSELFEYPPTRSNRAKWALEELGIAYTSHQVNFMQGEQSKDKYRAIHALGHVPAYRTKEYTMHESVAIVMQLLDEHPASSLAPALGTAERATYYQWSVFAASELDHNLFNYMQHTMHLPESRRNDEIAMLAAQNFAERAVVLSDTLESKTYLLGSHFSGADICIGYSCNWAAYTGLLNNHPVLVDYYARLENRSAFQEVFATDPA